MEQAKTHHCLLFEHVLDYFTVNALYHVTYLTATATTQSAVIESISYLLALFNRVMFLPAENKKLSYRRETARQLRMST